MNTLKERTEQAIARGIVPGAVIKCANTPKEFAVVWPYEKWTISDSGSLMCAEEGDACVAYGYFAGQGRWAEVISPVPAPKPEPVGLQDGDACECSPKMQEAILELAEELGVGIERFPSERCSGAWFATNGCVTRFQRESRVGKNDLSKYPRLLPEEFIARLRVYAANMKPNRSGRKVTVTVEGKEYIATID